MQQRLLRANGDGCAKKIGAPTPTAQQRCGATGLVQTRGGVSAACACMHGGWCHPVRIPGYPASNTPSNETQQRGGKSPAQAAGSKSPCQHVSSRQTCQQPTARPLQRAQAPAAAGGRGQRCTGVTRVALVRMCVQSLHAAPRCTRGSAARGAGQKCQNGVAVAATLQQLAGTHLPQEGPSPAKPTTPPPRLSRRHTGTASSTTQAVASKHVGGAQARAQLLRAERACAAAPQQAMH